MKILITFNVPYTRIDGGANRSNKALAEALVARGHDVFALSPALATPSPLTYAQWRDALVASGVVIESGEHEDTFDLAAVHVTAVREARDVRACLVARIHHVAPDWVLVSSEDPSQTLLAAALDAAPGRVAYMALTPQLFPFGPESLYPGARRADLVRRAELVFCLSTAAAEYLGEHAGVEAQVYAPPHFGPGPFPRLGNLDGSVLLMNACDVKGLPIFLDMVRSAPDRRFAALPGYGTTPANRAAIDALANVELWENAPDLDEVFARTSVLAVPSLWMESFGLAVVDAMLRGVPVLAADHGALPEAKLGTEFLLPVRPITAFREDLDENHLLAPIVSEQDAAPWSEALSELLGDKATYNRHSEQAWRAANAFVRRLSVEPFERALLEHERRASIVLASGAAAPDGRERRLAPADRSALIERFRRPRGAVTPSRLGRVDRDGRILASAQQHQLWLLHHLFPGSSAYNCANGLLMRGHLDVPALRRALQALVARHEALRTTFAAPDGDLVQVIADERDAAAQLTVLSEGAEPGTLDAWMLREAARRFDLTTGPLMRCVLRRTGDGEHVLMLTLHHIVCDGWSAGILVRDLSTLYAAFAAGQASPLPALERDGADYVAWQRARLSGERRDVVLEYWRSRLSMAPPTLDLPLDRPRRAGGAHRGKEIAFVVPAAQVAALRDIAVSGGATLFMALTTAFATVLARLCGETDIVVGTPVAGRQHPGAEQMVGFFVNTVVLRIDAGGDPTFEELLDRVRDTTLDVLTYQDLPFERLVEELVPDRSLGHSPIFQVMIAFANTPGGDVSLAGLEIEHRPVPNGAAKFDLNLELAQAGDGIEGILEYDSDLFDGSTAQTIGDSLLSVVADAVARPASRLGEIAVLEPAAELALRERLSVDAPAQWLKDSVVDLFAEQVRRVPEALAVASGRTRWTYGELDRRSDELAATLLERGVGPGRNAAICLARGAEFVLAVLAVLKTGAAYVPLDPQQPEAHVRRIAGDAAPQVLLTVDGVGPDLADAVPARLDVNAAIGASALRDAGRPVRRPIHPDDLVYVMYTSGSTGRAKGVGLTHRAAAHLVRWHRAKFPRPARTMQFAAVGFDVSFYEVLATLCWGGSLHVVPEADKRDLRRLPGFLREHGIERAELPAVLLPLLAEQWLEQGGDELPVRDLSCTGEQLELTAPVREFVHAHPRLALHNDYGPTETHIVTSSVLSAREDLGGPLPPIGVPVTGSRLYVLDRHGRLAPPGIRGELFVAGACLARGYHAAPALTAERFVPDPYASQPGQRMYRTGDRARLRADGELEYLGRLDDQVKVRGMRVEPTGVEVTLRRMGAVSNAAVIARRGTDATQELVAYVVPNELPGPTAAAIRQELSDELPRHMVPSQIIMLDRLPLTPNGKVDRSALPDPAPQPAPRGIGPRTELERRLVAIWESVLGRDGVGVHDSFFDLGGYSLRMLQVVSRIHETWAVEIPMESFFREPTIEHLAIVVTELLSVRGDESLDDLLDRIEQIDDVEAAAGDEAHRGPAAAHIAGAAVAGRAGEAGDEISAFGFPSSNRPRDLDACVRSYLTNAREHDRCIDAVVCSDPRDDATDRAYREVLASAQRDLGMPIWYAGPAEKGAYIAALAAEGVSAEVAAFALLPSGAPARAYGTNRNSLLLHNVGSLFVSVDDDTRADLGLPLAHAEGVRFRSDPGVSEIRVLSDRTQSAAFIASVALDLVGLHTGLLGAPAREVVAHRCHGGAPDANGAPDLDGASVVGTCHGWLGDCGWPSPRDGLFLSGDSWSWLTRTETAYRAAIQSREQVRYVERLTLFRGPEFFVVAAGLDGRAALPPFLPVHRREDYWFGQLVHTILPDAVIAHLPATVVHGDGTPRSYAQPDGVDVAMLLAACVERFDAPLDAIPGPRRMEALGRYLVELAGLSDDDQDERIGAAVAAYLENDIAELEERVATCPADRSFWARDMRRILELGRLPQHGEWFVPASLARGGDGRAELRTLLRRVGHLLAEWPSLLGAAAALRDRGVRLAQPVAGDGRAR